MNSSEKPPSTNSLDKVHPLAWLVVGVGATLFLAGAFYLVEYGDAHYPPPWGFISGVIGPLSMAVLGISSKFGRWRWAGETLATLIVLVTVVYPFVRYGLGLW